MSTTSSATRFSVVDKLYFYRARPVKCFSHLPNRSAQRRATDALSRLAQPSQTRARAASFMPAQPRARASQTRSGISLRRPSRAPRAHQPADARAHRHHFATFPKYGRSTLAAGAR